MMESESGSGYDCSPMCVQGTCGIDSKCVCSEGWTNDDCSVPICSPECENGICTNQRQCQCTDQWEGIDCNTPVCDPSCGSNGRCTRDMKCDCDLGWFGNNCTIQLSPPNITETEVAVTSIGASWSFLETCSDPQFEGIVFIPSNRSSAMSTANTTFTFTTLGKTVKVSSRSPSTVYCFQLKGFCGRSSTNLSSPYCVETLDEPSFNDSVVTARRLVQGVGQVALHNGMTIAIAGAIQDQSSYYGAIYGFLFTLQLNIVNFKRLVPYGELYGDQMFEFSYRYYYDSLYGERFTLESEMPFFDLEQDQKLLYISHFGYVSIGEPYSNPWNRAHFPLTGKVPMLAAMWWWYRTTVYVNEYRLNAGSGYDDAIIALVRSNLQINHNVSLDFNPETVLAITWQSDSYLKFTAQMLLITNGIVTYALINFDDENWSFPSYYSSYYWARRYGPVIGFSAGDGLNFRTLDEDFWNLHNIKGNTGVVGSWLFPLVTVNTENGAQARCLAWYEREKVNGSVDFVLESTLNACPCTIAQARRNWRMGWAWGFRYSTRENCTVMWWPRRNGWSWWGSEPIGTKECCYDENGLILVGPKLGGTSHRYHHYYESAQFVNSEYVPYQDCCVHTKKTKFCNYYYKLRISDDCSSYDENIARFMGDPHFSSFDGLDYTFNGKGEFWLVQTTDSSVSIQVRLTPTDNGKATVITAAAIAFEASLTANAYISEVDNTSVIVQIGDLIFNAADVLNTTYIGINGAQLEIDLMDSNSFNLLQNVSFILENDTNGISISPQDNSLSVTIRIQAPGVLTITTDINGNGLQNKTQGLLGVLNADSSDDFKLPDGTIPDLNATHDRNVYFAFGMKWRVSEMDNLFLYRGDDSYDKVNDQTDFNPQFGLNSSIPIPESILTACNGNQRCLFDYQVTQDETIAVSTSREIANLEETRQVLVAPPRIGGPSQIRLVAGQAFTTQYDSNATLTLLSPSPAGVSMIDGVLSWSSPPTEVPTANIQILASATDANSTLSVFVILCSCANGGQCIETATPNFGGTSYYQEQCNCLPAYDGSRCENDVDGCSQNPCRDPSLCEDISAPGVGFNCTGCVEGYQLSDNMCEDIDECSVTDICQLHASCTNTQGSYQCVCDTGYQLNNLDCEDIDECTEGSAECEQTCVNTDGSFRCTCLEGFTQDPASGDCTATNVCVLPCGFGTCASVDGEARCICPPGMMSSGTAACSACISGTFGFNCSMPCNCQNGGVCDVIRGCLCPEGWRGSNCMTRVNNFVPEFSSALPTMVTITDQDNVGSLIAEFVASDRDGDQIEYSFSEFIALNAYEDGRPFFTINYTSGDLTLRNQPDGSGPYLLVIMATDSGSGRLQSSPFYLVIQIISRYDRIITLGFRENDTVGTTIDGLQCSNTTANVTVLINTLIQGQFDFSAYPSVRLTSQLNYEDRQVYPFEIQCTELDGQRIDASVKITVSDVNDNNPILSYSSKSPDGMLHILENNRLFDLAGYVDVSDADSGKNGNISFVFNPPDVPVSINSKGEFIMSSFVNFEEKESYNFTVTAVDCGEPVKSSDTLTFTLKVGDVDDPPVFDGAAYVAHMPDYTDVLPSSLLALSVGDDDTSSIQLAVNVPWLTASLESQSVSILKYPNVESSKVGTADFLASSAISQYLDGEQTPSTTAGVPVYLKTELSAGDASSVTVPLYIVVFPRDSLIKVTLTSSSDQAMSELHNRTFEITSVFTESVKEHSYTPGFKYRFEVFTMERNGSELNIYGYFHNSSQSGALTRTTLRHNYHFLTQNAVRNILAGDYTHSQVSAALGSTVEYVVDGALTAPVPTSTANPTTLPADTLPNWAIATIVVGATVALVVFFAVGLLLGYILRRFRRGPKAAMLSSEFVMPNLHENDTNTEGINMYETDGTGRVTVDQESNLETEFVIMNFPEAAANEGTMDQEDQGSED